METQYLFTVEMSINEGEALILVTADDGERSACAMYTVDADGTTALDTDSDGCEANPFEVGGLWPSPPRTYIHAARQLARAT